MADNDQNFNNNGHNHDDKVSAPRDIGDQFEPLLRTACNNRLGPVSWFRADWQRGGAKTGRSTFEVTPESKLNAVVKIPVGPNEFLWHNRMQFNKDCGQEYGVTANLYACNTSLEGYDLAWLVMERFSEGPLFGLVRNDAIHLMCDVAARFHARAAEYEIDKDPKSENWDELLEKARESVLMNVLPQHQHWQQYLKTISRSIDSIIEKWRSRPCQDWCHGDLHPANAMSRSKNPEDPAMLIDLAEVHAGHWVEDAVYLERLFWTRPSLLEEYPPVKLIARGRKKLGLPVSETDYHLADIRRVLLAATAPAFLRTEGNPRYLDACLAVLVDVTARIC